MTVVVLVHTWRPTPVVWAGTRQVSMIARLARPLYKYLAISSVDLHQLYEVQRENPAAISLIISPKHRECPIYSLTHLGMSRISNCSSSSRHTFHRHNDMPQLYNRAMNIATTSDILTIYEDMQ